jgi:hypothetical protein
VKTVLNLLNLATHPLAFPSSLCASYSPIAMPHPPQRCLGVHSARDAARRGISMGDALARNLWTRPLVGLFRLLSVT